MFLSASVSGSGLQGIVRIVVAARTLVKGKSRQLMAWMNSGGMPHDKVLRSMRLLSGRVLPGLF
jgi:hypothetical protein